MKLLSALCCSLLFSISAFGQTPYPPLTAPPSAKEIGPKTISYTVRGNETPPTELKTYTTYTVLAWRSHILEAAKYTCTFAQTEVKPVLGPLSITQRAPSCSDPTEQARNAHNLQRRFGAALAWHTYKSTFIFSGKGKMESFCEVYKFQGPCTGPRRPRVEAYLIIRFPGNKVE